MIPVALRPEPSDFDRKVRRPGVAWLTSAAIPRGAGLPSGTKLEPYWTECLDDLYEAYGGTCAYLAVFFESTLGAHSTDHLVAKSSDPWLAYEWSNFRLACLAMNRRKNRFDDVLDPFFLEPETFHLELVTGRLVPNPALSGTRLEMALATRERLALDSPACRSMRSRHFVEYLRSIDGAANPDWHRERLRRDSPFVWYEARRQGLL